MPRAYGGPMFLGLLAAPDLFADDHVLLSYLAITHDIFSFLFSPPSNGRKFIVTNISNMDVPFVLFFRFEGYSLFFFFFFFLIEAII